MRLFFKIILGLVALVFIALAIFLVPQHLQVRGVEPDLPDEAALRSLMTVENGPIAVRYIVNASQPVGDRALSHLSFLIEWENGNLFMIDAGMDEDAAAAFAELIGTLSGGGEGTFFGTVADQMADNIQQVKGVGFTHLHIDHTQGIEAFCDARGSGAELYQTDWQLSLQNFNTTEGAALLANSCLTRGALQDAPIMTSPNFPGLGLVGLGGHTPGSTLFAVGLKDRLWLFSGDTTNTHGDILSNTGKGFVYSGLLVPENTARTEALRLWLRELDAKNDINVVVSHDLAALQTTGMAPFAP